MHFIKHNMTQMLRKYVVSMQWFSTNHKGFITMAKLWRHLSGLIDRLDMDCKIII